MFPIKWHFDLKHLEVNKNKGKLMDICFYRPKLQKKIELKWMQNWNYQTVWTFFLICSLYLFCIINYIINYQIWLESDYVNYFTLNVIG